MGASAQARTRRNGAANGSALEHAEGLVEPSTRKLVAFAYAEMLVNLKMRLTECHVLRIGNLLDPDSAAIVSGQYVERDDGDAEATVTELGDDGEQKKTDLKCLSWRTWEAESTAALVDLEQEVRDCKLESYVDVAMGEITKMREDQITAKLAEAGKPNERAEVPAEAVAEQDRAAD